MVLHLSHVLKSMYIVHYTRLHCMNTLSRMLPLGHYSNSLPLALESITPRHLYVCASILGCESCLLGKMTKTPFTKSCERAGGLLELVHSDVCCPMSTTARGGYEYSVSY